MIKNFPLIIETYPDDYVGYEFITLIRFNDENFLNIVDNVSNTAIFSYVLDMCVPNGIDELAIIEVADNWYRNHRDEYPISLEFSKLGLMASTSKILRTFPIDYVTRVIGPLFEYKMGEVKKVRKRKKKEIPAGCEIVPKE